MVTVDFFVWMYRMYIRTRFTSIKRLSEKSPFLFRKFLALQSRINLIFMFQPFFYISKTYLNKNQFSSTISYILLFPTWMSLELYCRDRNSDIWLSGQFRRDIHLATPHSPQSANLTVSVAGTFSKICSQILRGKRNSLRKFVKFSKKSWKR